MEDEKVKAELIRLTKNFVEAVNGRDKETAAQIADRRLKHEFRMFGSSSTLDFDSDNLKAVDAYDFLLETEPYLYPGRRRARVVYEINTDWHMMGTKFQSGFIRQSFFYEKTPDGWKLIYLKSEFRRFSGYNLKKSFDGLSVRLSLIGQKTNG